MALFRSRPRPPTELIPCGIGGTSRICQGRFSPVSLRASSGPQGNAELEHKARQLLEADPEARARLEALDEAAAVVARLQTERDRVDRLLSSANASSRSAPDADRLAEEALLRDVESALRDLAAATGEVEAARQERHQLQVILQQGEDRIESAKAGAVAALGGVVGSIPFAFTADGFSSKLWLALGSALLSSALFGIVMRYAVRQDWRDLQLKQGVILAFGFARGLAQLDASPAPSLEDLGSLIGFAEAVAVSVGTSTIMFGFAGVAVQVGIVSGWLQACTRTSDT